MLVVNTFINMEKILTAKEFWDFKCKTDELKSPGDIMIEFAKLHVQAALKQAVIEASVEDYSVLGEDSLFYRVEENSILNSYPLTNIK